MAKRPATSPQAALSPRFARQHGCAWFDIEPGADLRTAGIWVSRGGEPFERVHGVSALDPGVVWWSNLTLAQTWMVGRLAQIKDSSWLGMAWPDLLSEQGQRPDGAVVELWSETYARLAEWVSELARVLQPDRPWAWGEGRLEDVLANRWNWFVPRDRASRPQPVLNAAWVDRVEHVPPGGPQQWSGRRRVVLGLPRAVHARQVWSSRIPAGAWTLVEEGDWPRVPEERLRWLQAQRQPLLIRVDRVEWSAGQDELGRTWLGLRGRRYAADIPEPIWMTGDEALDLARWGRFEIESAYQAERWEYGSLPEWLEGELNDSPLGETSLMLGLVAQATWQAASSPTRDPQQRTSGATEASMVWRRAADRRACFEAAQRLLARGIPVMNHGQGQVTIAADAHMPLPELAEAIKGAGLVLPRALALQLPLQESMASDNPLDVLHWLARSGEVNALWDVDRLVAPWLGPGTEITQLLNNAARRLARIDSSSCPALGTWWRQALPAQLTRAAERLRSAAHRRGRVAA